MEKQFSVSAGDHRESAEEIEENIEKIKNPEDEGRIKIKKALGLE